jgi:uncharacterized protein YkwD
MSYTVSSLATEVTAEMSKVRQNPASLIPYLEDHRSQFRGMMYRNNGINMMTKEGTVAVDEAITYLRSCRPCSALKLSIAMSRAAQDHVDDQGPKGAFGHNGSDGSTSDGRVQRYGSWLYTFGENISYGPNTGLEIVAQLIVDDGVPDRGHRTNMFNPDFNVCGVACGSHTKYRNMCVITYAGGFSSSSRPLPESVPIERAPADKPQTERDEPSYTPSGILKSVIRFIGLE